MDAIRRMLAWVGRQAGAAWRFFSAPVRGAIRRKLNQAELGRAAANGLSAAVIVAVLQVLGDVLMQWPEQTGTIRDVSAAIGGIVAVLQLVMRWTQGDEPDGLEPGDAAPPEIERTPALPVVRRNRDGHPRHMKEG